MVAPLTIICSSRWFRAVPNAEGQTYYALCQPHPLLRLEILDPIEQVFQLANRDSRQT